MSSKTDKSTCAGCISKCQQVSLTAQDTLVQKNLSQTQPVTKLEPTVLREVLSKSKKYLSPEYGVKVEKGRRNSVHEIGKSAEKERRHSAHDCSCRLAGGNVREQKNFVPKTTKDVSKTQQLTTASDPYNSSSAAACNETIYGRIINNKVKADIIYEDEHVVAFFDPEPQAPIHFIVVPRKPIARLEDATEEDEALLGKLLLTAAKTAKKLGCVGGYRVVINNGRNACQKINYLHLHVFGGKQLGWPPC